MWSSGELARASTRLLCIALVVVACVAATASAKAAAAPPPPPASHERLCRVGEGATAQWHFCKSKKSAHPPLAVQVRYVEVWQRIHICYEGASGYWLYCNSDERIKEEKLPDAKPQKRELCENPTYGVWFFCDSSDTITPPTEVQRAFNEARIRLPICRAADKLSWLHCNTDEEIAKADDL